MKYANESAAGRARADAFMKGAEQGQPSEAPTTRAGSKVDTSVTLGPLQGEIRGAVPMDVTIGKPQAYTAKKGSA